MAAYPHVLRALYGKLQDYLWGSRTHNWTHKENVAQVAFETVSQAMSQPAMQQYLASMHITDTAAFRNHVLHVVGLNVAYRLGLDFNTLITPEADSIMVDAADYSTEYVIGVNAVGRYSLKGMQGAFPALRVKTIDVTKDFKSMHHTIRPVNNQSMGTAQVGLVYEGSTEVVEYFHRDSGVWDTTWQWFEANALGVFEAVNRVGGVVTGAIVIQATGGKMTVMLAYSITMWLGVPKYVLTTQVGNQTIVDYLPSPGDIKDTVFTRDNLHATSKISAMARAGAVMTLHPNLAMKLLAASQVVVNLIRWHMQPQAPPLTTWEGSKLTPEEYSEIYSNEVLMLIDTMVNVHMFNTVGLPGQIGRASCRERV